MIPVLFEGTATSFTTNGLGRLVDAVECLATEERNGQFELEMKYPVIGQHYDDIGLNKLILAKPNRNQNPQAFEIYKISVPIKGIVTINARHISYRLNYVPVKPFTAQGIQGVLSGLLTNSLENHPFTVTTDIVNTQTTYNQIEPKPFRACLGGSDGSLLDLFASRGTGEYEWDNFNVKLWSHRGTDRGVQLRYAVNITDLNREVSSEDLITGAVAWWHNADDTIIEFGEVQYAPNASSHPVHKTVLLDVSSDMDAQPSLSQLNSMASDYVATQGVLKENIKVSFADLYEDSSELDVRLCDTVTVIYMPMGVRTTKEIIKTEWDVLRDRYYLIEAGDASSSLASTIIDAVGDIESIVQKNSRIISVVQTVNRELGSISSTVAQTTEDITGIKTAVSTLEQTAEEISQTVTRIEGDYVTQSAFNQTADNVQFQFSQVQDAVDSNTEGLATLQTGITLDNNGVTVGKSDSDIRGVFGNNSLDFLDTSDTRLAWLSTEDGLGASEISIGDPTNSALAKKKRWRLIVSEDGYHFRITRHT